MSISLTLMLAAETYFSSHILRCPQNLDTDQAISLQACALLPAQLCGAIHLYTDYPYFLQ
jgi:hypothetical protein